MKKIRLEDLIKNVKTYNENTELILKAYYLAEELHQNQTRDSGEPYIIHPLAVAYILSELKADINTICAGLLHDTIEDTNITKEQIEELFNKEVADLVDGVTKISNIKFLTKEEENIANTRKIITGITKDVRIIIIKLVDRLHNMRTLEFKKEEKQKAKALETMEIFVPLAYLIGAHKIKHELEDLSFKYINKEEYDRIEDIRQNIEEESIFYLKEMQETITKILKSNDIESSGKIKFKNTYGIYKKEKEGLKITNIKDLLALKIMVENIPECYQSLGLIHSIYSPINGQIHDYICNPKTNMYRSLHTTLFGPKDYLVQAQIRTYEMDDIASFGLTAYWNINKENARYVMQKDLREKYQFFQSIKEINRTFKSDETFYNQLKKEILSKKIYIYTTNGNIIELPEGATAIDAAYKIGTEYGDNIIAAEVNSEIVKPDYILENNDRIKIITSDYSNGPQSEWKDKVQTTKAIRKVLKNT